MDVKIDVCMLCVNIAQAYIHAHHMIGNEHSRNERCKRCGCGSMLALIVCALNRVDLG